ncbi:hypothetical protein HPB49_025325 [Dermacentor silvarum]|uniref:Uncharacterized protein n=1 Tax=Dermacentor silvarum TaxID=543639 RepID=A0ACB8CII4_DERSI|nr:hypothetical protein HPB49_025325 [Dermacentor silvarum]
MLMCNVPNCTQFHRGLMTLALLCILASLACVFTAVGGWSFVEHAACIFLVALTKNSTTVASTVQPIMALFRCHPGEPGRPLFNWLHWANGNVAQSIALVTIYFAPGLTKSRLGGSGEFLTVLSLLVAFHVAVHVGMQALSMLSATPTPAPLPAAADEPKRDSPVPPPGASQGASTAQPTEDGGKEADKEDRASGDAETASKDAADDEASDKKSPAAAVGAVDAVADGAAAGTNPGADLSAQGDAAAAPAPPAAPAAPAPEAVATSALDKIRVVGLAVYTLVMLGAVAALVGIVWSA